MSAPLRDHAVLPTPTLMTHATSQGVDPQVVARHLPQDPLKHQGGDIARQIINDMPQEQQSQYGQENNLLEGPLCALSLRRSLLFSAVQDAHRRELTASDINVVGGFRRDFLVQKLIRNHQKPPTFATDNFFEFLTLYGHFAGELMDLDAEDDELVFDDDESPLLRPPLPQGVPDLRRPYGATQSATQSAGKKALVAKTYFLVFKSLVGLGVLFLPRAFYNGGLGFSIVTLLMFGALTFFCYLVLILSKRELQLPLFGELAYRLYGSPLKWCVTVLILVSQIGFVGTYLLFTMENMGKFLGIYFGKDRITPVEIFIAQFLILVPLVLVRNLTKLLAVSLVSSICIVVGLIIIFFFCGQLLIHNGWGPNIAQFNSNLWTMLVGVAVTSFEGIGLILPIENSMANPEKFTEVLVVLMALITALFVAVGTISYTAFGDKVALIIILNLPESNLFVQSIMVLYLIAVLLTAPLQLFPAIKIGELVVFHPKRSDRTGKLYTPLGKKSAKVKWRKNAFRVTVLLAVCVVAYLNANNIDKFVSINGCFACIPLVYIYPPLIHMRMIHRRGHFVLKGERMMYYGDWVVVTLGFMVMVYLAYQIFFLN